MGVYGISSKLKGELDNIYELFPILKERSRQSANTLSGGEQQQLAIARALVSSPRLLLVDEVSMGLMPKLAAQVFEVLRSLNKDEGFTILLVEQNALSSLNISDRGYVLETGNIIIEGTASELVRDERVRESYLGIQ
jgi:branched-chain amino acid transport system ATP-binding protein